MNFFKRANSLNISILNPLILWLSSELDGAVVGVVGTEVGTGGGAISDVVGGAIDELVGTLGGNGGVDIVGGATLGGTTVVGLAEVDGPNGGIFGGVGIGDTGVLGGVPELGGTTVGTGGIAVLTGGPAVGMLGGIEPGTLGAVGGIPGIPDVGGGGVVAEGVVGITSPINLSLLCSKLSARD